MHKQQTDWTESANGSGGDEWQDCPPGTISAMTTRLSKKQQWQRRMRVAKATSMAAMLLVVVGLGWQWSAQNDPQQLGALTCAEVVEVDQQFVESRLTPEMQARIEKHLAKCPKCVDHMQQLRTQLDDGVISWNRLISQIVDVKLATLMR